MAAETQAQVEPPTPGPAAGARRRRLRAPEVIQTSAMDCGPAALKCLLEGLGIPVSYGRLREACQTSVDGTSIDTLETMAQMLGLDAEQVMVPVEHVLAPTAELLPAIAVVRTPSGVSHFVVLWRQVGPYVQLMDPARGRRWARSTTFLRDLHRHTQTIDVAVFHPFVTDQGFTAPLAWRLRRLVGGARLRAWQPGLEAAQTDPSWKPMIRLDGAIRAVETLVDAGAVRRGSEADNLARALWRQSGGATAGHAEAELAAVLEAHSCARPAEPDADGAAQVRFSGAVLVRIARRMPQPTAPSSVATDGPEAREPSLPPELRAALNERPPSVARTLMGLWTAPARALALLAAALIPLAAVGGVGEVFFARPLLSSPASGRGGVTGAERVGAVGEGVAAAFLVLCAVVLAVWAVDLPLALMARKLGRALDQGLRRAFLRKLPRLGDRYFSSRAVSDMAERAHLLHRVRLLPALIAQLGRCGMELALMTVAIAWLYPPGTPLVVTLFLLCVLLPLLAGPALAERDLRLRTHAGSLMQFYVDALLGLSAVKTHRAESAMMREQGLRLTEWRRAASDLVRTSLTIEAALLVVVALGAGLLVMRSFDAAEARRLAGLDHGGAAAGLLLLFFALGLPGQAVRLMGLWRQLPDHRNVTLRLLEPLGAAEERRGGDDLQAVVVGPEAAMAPPPRPAAAAIALQEVAVDVGGHRVLSGVSLNIAPGSHVAVVGASGAGKSTLLGLLLGFHVPVQGRVLVDGHDLNGEAGCLTSLRRFTAWVEPNVQLWNQSLADNVSYGSAQPLRDEDLERVLKEVELSEQVARWPAGVHTRLGEGGGLLSGGEGQRVRLAREMLRVRGPRLVLLDEPFRGLDGPTRRRFLAEARARWAEATLIAATHDIAHTRDFSRVLVIAGGQIVEDGDPAALAVAPASYYRALLDAEARVRGERWSASAWRRWTVGNAGVRAHES